MENGILGGLLGGLLVGAMPGIQRKGSHVSVGVRQHRPRFVLYLGWGILLFILIPFPLFIDIMFGFDLGMHIFIFILGAPMGLVVIINYYVLYIRFDEHSVTWRNSLGRTYTASYTSVDRLTYLDNNRNGWIRIIFRDQGKRKRLSFDPGQFDGTVIFGHILYKVRTGEWASSVQQLSESGFLEGRESFEALREIRFVRNLQASAPHTA